MAVVVEPAAVELLDHGKASSSTSGWSTSPCPTALCCSFDVAFVADNPGIWIDHCHQLSHAAQGLVAHLAYLGIDEPFLIGGNAGNDPE